MAVARNFDPAVSRILVNDWDQKLKAMLEQEDRTNTLSFFLKE